MVRPRPVPLGRCGASQPPTSPLSGAEPPITGPRAPLSDAEVIAVELSTAGAASTAASDRSLERSLDQIERLAAELAQLTAPAGVTADDEESGSKESPDEASLSAGATSADADTTTAEAAEPPDIAETEAADSGDTDRDLRPRPAPHRPRPLFTWSGPAPPAPTPSPEPAPTPSPEPAPTPSAAPAPTPADLPRTDFPRAMRIGAISQVTRVLPALPVVSRVHTPASAGSIDDATGSNRGPQPPIPPKVPAEKVRGHGRRHRSTTRRWLLALVVAVLAIPAFAIGAVQPWLREIGTDSDRLAVNSEGRSDQSGDPRILPNPAVPNAASTPSTASGPAAQQAPGRSGRPAVPGTESRQSSAGTSGDMPTSENPPASLRRGTAETLSVTVHANNVKPTVGETVRFRLDWRDGEGRFAGVTSQWGDGSPDGNTVGAMRCAGGEGNGTDVSGGEDLTHVFNQPGRYTVRLTVVTYTCDGAVERQAVPITIDVAPAPSSSPSPMAESTS